MSVYLDYNATTPVDPRVLDEMLPYFGNVFGNAASQHSSGQTAAYAVERARQQVADALGVPPSWVLFTSGATEATNLAIQGLTNAANGRRRRIVTFATEHKATLDACRYLAHRGRADVEILPADRAGRPSLDALAVALDTHTDLVSVIAANNETGVLTPLDDVVHLSHERGALVHCDATQAFGKVEFDMGNVGVDLASVSAHKVYGPKGVGALVVTSQVQRCLEPIIHGGGHERGFRSGTTNVPGVVGFGAAASYAIEERSTDAARASALRSKLEHGMSTVATPVVPPGVDRLPNTTNIRFPGVDADALLLAMPTIAASTGSACTAASPSPSHVLLAMGMSYDEAQECLRFSLGRPTTSDDVDAAITETFAALERVRGAVGKHPA